MSRTVLFLCIVSAFSCSAQDDDTIAWQEGILRQESWQRGDQFRTYYSIKVGEQMWKDEGGTRHRHFVTEAYWLKEQSYLPNDSLYYRELAQVLFDVYEVEARIFQQQVNNEKDDSEFLEEAYIDRANRKCAEIIKNSSNGRNSGVLKQYISDLQDQLQQIERHNEPNLEPTGLSARIQVNAAVIAGAGNFRKVVPSMYGYGAGFDFGYRSFLLSLVHSRGYSSVSDSFVKQDFGFYPGNRVQFRQWWYQLGYLVRPYRRINVAFYAGINTFRFINLSKPEGALTARGPVAINFSASAQVNYSFVPFSHENNGETQLELFLRVGYSRYNYLYELSGAGISIQAGLQLHIQTLEYPKPAFD